MQLTIITNIYYPLAHWMKGVRRNPAVGEEITALMYANDGIEFARCTPVTVVQRTARNGVVFVDPKHAHLSVSSWKLFSACGRIACSYTSSMRQLLMERA